VLATADSVLDILPALSKSPYGAEDIAVVFYSLNFDNAALLQHYWRADPRTLLVCYALARPQARWTHADLLTGDPGGPSHDVQICLVNTFKFGDDGTCPAIQAVLRRHLGDELVCGQTTH
jgi:hypothetical protein